MSTGGLRCSLIIECARALALSLFLLPPPPDPSPFPLTFLLRLLHERRFERDPKQRIRSWAPAMLELRAGDRAVVTRLGAALEGQVCVVGKYREKRSGLNKVRPGK